MRPSSSRSRSAALAAALALGVPLRAEAQSCCAGGSALTPARLSPHEDVLVGVQARATDIYGSFDGKHRFVGARTSEIDFEQDLAVSVRVLPRAQVSLLLPLVETWRRVPGISEIGAGAGDFQIGARYDLTLPGSSLRVPGIALSAGLSLPTGVAPESASHLLATDATGTGAFQGTFALAFEQTFGPVLVNLTGSTALRSARTVGGVREQQGMQFAFPAHWDPKLRIPRGQVVAAASIVSPKY